MRRFFILVADEFDQFAVEEDALIHSDSEWLRVRFRIFDGNVDFEIPIIRAAEPLGQFSIRR